MKINKKLYALLMGLLLITLSACSSQANAEDKYLPEAKNDFIMTSLPGNSDMRVSYIDVGQGDSEFIELPNGETLLIDAGTNETGEKAVNYIKSLGYTSIDYVVGTHPHEDHIGGLDDVINAFDIGKIYMPKITADTKTFEDVLDAIDSKGLTINTAKSGVSLVETDGLSVKMLAPVSDSYKNTNDYSAVVKIIYGDTSFLFMGDAEELSESQITDDVSADVLKAGHHGSSTSTSETFLDSVCPSAAIISCGRDNSYGHPHKETIEKFNERGIKYYRTDELGTITAISDGKNITINSSDINSANSSSSQSSLENSKNYVINTNTKKIHLESCSSVKSMSDNNKSYTDNYDKAIAEGYTPCGICKP